MVGEHCRWSLWDPGCWDPFELCPPRGDWKIQYIHDQKIRYVPPSFMIKIFNVSPLFFKIKIFDILIPLVVMLKIFNIFSLIFSCAYINYLTNLLIVFQIVSMLFVSLSDHDQFIWSLPIPFNQQSFTHSDSYQHQQSDYEVQHVFDPISAFGIHNNNLLLTS